MRLPRKNWMRSSSIMPRFRNAVLSVLLWFFGGTLYFFIEVAYKTITRHPERISWTMLALAIVLCIPVERCGHQLSWGCPLWLQAFFCAILVTIAEFCAGCVLNLWLGLDIWDYSEIPFNLFGQVCLPFFVAWFFLCLVFVPTFDVLRWCVEGGKFPTYNIK